MARRRFFVPEIRRGSAELTGRDAEHLVRVLRAEPGQVYELSDNRDLYLAEVEVARKSLVSFRVLEKMDTPVPAVHVCLLAALIKFERFEWLIEKATELGVSTIQPIESVRTERGLAEAAIKRLSRWEKVALEASQQSRRVHLPRIEPPFRLAKSPQVDANVRLLLDENPAARPILDSLPAERTPADHVALLVGPEGGWTDEEREQAVRTGWLACSLGPGILRAETAAVAALAVIQAAWVQSPPVPASHLPV
ncbi:MAG TPA: RsmE family RNA methyltransferase [Bryobacteraceae bacterium]|nr:RsmE family RNA methyltransferase [Bryobacteraceae bacterium]HTW67269.1 RsmE family RNA methyltransferase [Bryobacteraceae bacterium]